MKKKELKELLTVTLNDKGVLDLDTVKGCPYGIANNPKGCWGLCYAKKIADFYGWDFSKGILRKLESESQINNIIKTINNADLPFIRVGTMGEPCTDWGHTVRTVRFLSKYINKRIVIITKHWKTLTDEQMEILGKCKVIINTSTSALDTPEQRQHRLSQYNRYKKYGTSILRIVSCDFNRDNKEGKRLAEIQDELFKNENVIDNPLRLHSKYELYLKGIIKAEKLWDLNTKVLISRFNSETYIGKCKDCPEQCGLFFEIWKTRIKPVLL